MCIGEPAGQGRCGGQSARGGSTKASSRCILPLAPSGPAGAHAAQLLAPLTPDLLPPEAVQRGLTLREGRLVYQDSAAAVALLANLMRRVVWRDLFADKEPMTVRTIEGAC